MKLPSNEEAKAYLASAGIFAPWYLRDSQLDIYELLVDCKEPFIEASRRFGKTTSIAVFVHELLKANPGWVCRWCLPDKQQARQIVKPIFSHIQNTTPKSQRARWITTDSHYRYPNGSILYLVGVNHDKGESARGPAANIIVLDEYGFWLEAEYVAKSILFPQLQNQEGQWFIKASTPPPDLGHIYYKEKDVAIRKGKFIQKLIWDNEALTQKELDKIIEEAGGIDSVTFKREYLCQEIVDPKKIVIGEFTKENIVPDAYPRPEFFVPYISIDSGADDNTACLFGYHDFKLNEVIIERELLINGSTTKTIIQACKLIELALWSDNITINYPDLLKKTLDVSLPAAERQSLENYVKKLFREGNKFAERRVYDGDKQLVYDVLRDHEYSVTLPDKANKIAGINGLKIEVGARRFKIKESCTQTIRQFEVGQWRDEKHLDFARNEELGHLDAIASAVYFNRCVDRTKNPFPQNYGLHREQHFITPSSRPIGKTEQALTTLFRPKNGRFR